MAFVGSRTQQVYGMMKDFPSCLGENGVQVSDSSPSSRSPPQNLVVSVYRLHSQAFSGFITITWIKNLIAQALTIAVENSANVCLGKADIRPWLFSKRKGFKNMVVDSIGVDIYWDLSSAKFGSGPEPLEGFYIAIAINQELCLILGDLHSEVYKKIDQIQVPFASKASLVARKEHVFGKRLYNCKARFGEEGRLHDIGIQYEPSERCGKCLTMFVDRKAVLQVTRLKWKFRGNQSILVDGVCVQVYWDVHSWLFHNDVVGSAIFLFRSGGEELGWKEKEKDLDLDLCSDGFSLVLCAWKTE